MLKLNDVLLIGPYTYKVIGVRGAWAVLEFKTSAGVIKHATVKQGRSVQLCAA